MKSTGKPIHKLDSLVLLRGIAVLTVCGCHYSFALNSVKTGLQSHVYNWFSTYGQTSVMMFFVISGFVIPLSLHTGKYQLTDYFRYLYKRLLRLQPPYLISLAFTFVLMYISGLVKNIPFPPSATDIVMSIFYMYVPSENPLYWTLQVEAQYYLLIGLLFVVLSKKTVLTYLILFPLLLLASFTPLKEAFLLTHFLVYFLLGIVGFRLYTELPHKWLSVFVAILLVAFMLKFHKVSESLVSLGTFLFILGYKGRIHRFLQFPGQISYSLYLVHFPIGIKFLNLTKERVDESYYWVLFLAAMGITIFAAWLFYMLIEVFSERLSKRIKYKTAMVKSTGTEEGNQLNTVSQ